MTVVLRKAALAALCAGALAGCAAAPLQETAARRQNGRGAVVYLALTGNGWQERQDLDRSPHRGKYSPKKAVRKRLILPRKIEMVQVKDDRGNTSASYVLPVYAGDLVLQQLKQELTAAGYAAVPVRTLPSRPALALAVTAVETDLEQRSGLFSLEGRCNLRVRVDHWRHGSRQESRGYRSSLSGEAVQDQHLLRRLLDQAARSVAVQALADLRAAP